MPKKWNSNHAGNRNTFNSEYFYHDDRVGVNKQKRRVNFKTPAHVKGKGPNRILQMALKNCLDDDVSMGDGEQFRGRHSPVTIPNVARRGILNRNKVSIPTVNWYKVIIPYGNKYSKDFILKSIADIINPNTFVPIMYKTFDKESVFYLDNEEDADRIHCCNNKITLNDGFKLRIIVRPGYPNIAANDITQEFQDKIKVALGKRFFEANNALDLTNFHRDSELVGDYFCALFRPIIMKLVIDIVAQHIPNVMAINFNDNKLLDLRSLKSLKSQFKSLKILYLGNNKIKELNQIDNIKDLELEELVLQGNPLCNRFQSRRNDYISEIQKKFPTLRRIDGQELSKRISFDLEEEGKNLLPSKMLFAINEESKTVAMSFLMEYFRVFDSGNRQNLMNAYHEQASFSMTVSFQSQPHKLNFYLQENRNLLRISDPIKRHKLLKTGRIHVISHIVGLPKSQHIEQSFTMDVSLATKDMIIVIVTGLFKELDGKNEPLRYFNRTLIIVPEGNGFCICNEQLHISHASDEQEKKFGLLAKSQSGASTSTALAVQTPSQSLAGPSSTLSTTSTTTSSEDMQRMAMALSQQSNMNLEWSIKCLQECNWNYDNAFAAFQTCLKNGQIPAEAFIK